MYYPILFEKEGDRSYKVGEKYILSPVCVGAISHRAMLLCACHLNDKWSYCGQRCTLYVASIQKY